MSDDLQDPKSAPCCGSESVIKKIGVGAAVVALPLAAFGVYRALESASEPADQTTGKTVSLDAVLRQVDPALIKYKEAGRIETGLARPRAIAVNGKGELFVAAENTVRRLSSSGALLAEVAITGMPYCLAGDDTGTMFVGMKDHVQVFGPDGKLLKTWPSFGDKAFLTCITLAGQDVWIGDAGRRIAVRCDRDGKVLGEIAKADPSRNIPGLVMPSPHLDVQVAPDGLVWVNNPGLHRLEAYSPDGQLQRFWGTPGNRIESFPGCCNPADFAILKDGSFITAEKVSPRVKRYLNDGTFEGVVAAPDAFGQNMTGIDVAVDGDGRVLLMERGQRDIRIFVPDDGSRP